MELKHFGHDHPLKPLEKTIDDYDEIRFQCCPWVHKDDDNKEVYGCEECNYFIHRACSEIPSEIQHFYHPDHPLKLCLQQPEEQVSCVACRYNSFLAYRCAECPHFTMDIKCALMPYKLENSGKSIRYYRHHGHPLTLHQRTDDDGTDYYCSVCGTLCLVGSVYGCDPCGAIYHESCTEIDIPQEIQHYFHPHPLRLTNQRNLRAPCLACRKYLRSFFVFECLDCASYMHIHCALLPDKLKQDGHVNHIHDFSHGHPLSLCEPGEEICKACKQSCADPTYGCKRCRYYIHESCTGLPHQINHPLHPPHLLTLTLIIPEGTYGHLEVFCNGCDKSDGEFLAYKCSECDFVLDLNCAGRNPTITSEEHQHVLTLTSEELYRYQNCVVCSSEIPDGSLYFACVDYCCSSYQRHLLCGPLPCTIKDSCHVDPLKLMDAFVEDYNETDEVYCDTCEELRDPNEPVYYCRECNFITEIKCVMSEVLRCLEGHHGNVKLRTANKTKIWYSGMVFSARCSNIIEEDDIDTETEREREIKYIREKYFEVKLDVSYKGLDFFTTEESAHILKSLKEACALYSHLSETILEMSASKTTGDTDFSWSELLCYIKKYGLRSSSSYAICEGYSGSDISSLALQWNEELVDPMRRFDSFYGGPNFFRMLDREAVIVGIGELMVMQHLASFLKGLLHAHGDFTANSTLEPRLKMFFLNLLCSVVRSMCTTNVREVDGRTFRRWWNSVQIVKHVGFEVEFLIDRLARIALALFGQQVRASSAKTKSKIDETYDEVKELEVKLDAKKRELEALKFDQISQRKDMEYERSPEMKECLEHESELKWKKAWEGSPVMFQSFLGS